VAQCSLVTLGIGIVVLIEVARAIRGSLATF
jgi:hypothetical protein